MAKITQINTFATILAGTLLLFTATAPFQNRPSSVQAYGPATAGRCTNGGSLRWRQYAACWLKN